ncbi:hypothetical protein C8R43DRAFT_188628 [Mycena crocata]|nr:hypothetical protein C8R43DRAFT_188628 [Mycena crocata]
MGCTETAGDLHSWTTSDVHSRFNTSHSLQIRNPRTLKLNVRSTSSVLGLFLAFPAGRVSFGPALPDLYVKPGTSLPESLVLLPGTSALRMLNVRGFRRSAKSSAGRRTLVHSPDPRLGNVQFFYPIAKALWRHPCHSHCCCGVASRSTHSFSRARPTRSFSRALLTPSLLFASGTDRLFCALWRAPRPRPRFVGASLTAPHPRVCVSGRQPASRAAHCAPGSHPSALRAGWQALLAA